MVPKRTPISTKVRWRPASSFIVITYRRQRRSYATSRLRIDQFSMRSQVGLPASNNSGVHQGHVWILFNIRSDLV